MLSSDPVESTRLWQRVAEDPHLADALRRLRERATRIATVSVATQPAMTDHTGRHFDKLWGVADLVLKETETQRLNPTEAFLLGATFYVHDLGMSYGFNDEAKNDLRTTAAYESARQRLGARSDADRLAIEMAIRQTHAGRAVDLCTKPLDDRDEFLIDSKEDRELYAHYIGRIASSHHWSIQRLKRDIGDKGRVAFGTAGAQADVGLVAAYLRVIDFAHINRDRSSTLERAMRPAMPGSSLEHWLGQESISGPIRENDYLKYTSSRRISDVDGWWLFYGMMRGLDEEIRATRRFLDSRPDTKNALSLRGVKGSEDPEEAARFIEPDGFAPLDVRVKADSIARIVGLLGGETLYGKSPLPAIRELVQNSTDAIRLKRKVTGQEDVGEIGVELHETGDATYLIVKDDGFGMNADIIRDYLLAVASDYWVSDRFAADVGTDVARAFRPAGRFGVGFLSVFMLGDEIEVRSQREGFEHVALHLRGKDRVGELRRSAGIARTGTEIKVRLDDGAAKRLGASISALPSLFPMTAVTVKVKTPTASYASVPKAWRTANVGEFLNRVYRTIESLAEATGYLPANEYEIERRIGHTRGRRIATLADRLAGDHDFGTKAQWGDAVPDLLGEGYRVAAVTQGVHSEGVVLCSRGIAVCTMPCRGFVGMIDEEDVKLDVSRTRPIGYDLGTKRGVWVKDIQPSVRASLESQARTLTLPTMQKHIGTCFSQYGHDLLDPSPLRWIWSFLDGRMSALNSAEFRTLAREKGKFALMYDFGPITALKWTDRVSELRGIPLIVQPEAMIHRHERDEQEPTEEERVTRGELKDLLPSYAEDGLLVAVLALAAQNHTKPLVDYVSTMTRWTLHRSGPRYSRSANLYGICES